MSNQQTSAEPSNKEKEALAYRRCLSVLTSNGRTREEAIAELGDHPGKPSNVSLDAAKAAVAAAQPLKRPGAGTKTHQAPKGTTPKPQGRDAGISRGAKLLVQGEQPPAAAPTPGPAVSEEEMGNWEETETGAGDGEGTGEQTEGQQ